MFTISASLLSGCSCKAMVRNIERTAAKRPDYLDISYREIRERGRKTYNEKGGVGHVMPHCFLPCIQLGPQFVVMLP